MGSTHSLPPRISMDIAFSMILGCGDVLGRVMSELLWFSISLLPNTRHQALPSDKGPQVMVSGLESSPELVATVRLKEEVGR